MKIWVAKLDSSAHASEARQGIAGAWAQFGDELLTIADDNASAPLDERAQPSATRVRELAAPVTRDELHLVVQKGRLFQKDHPDVPVLYDRGRFLVVRLDPQQAQACRRPHQTCYSITRLAERQVVFETLDRNRARAAPSAAVQALVDGVTRAGYEADLTHLAQLPTRHSLSTQFADACDWAVQTLDDLGFTSSREDIDVGGGTSHNVLAEKPGTLTGSRKVVLVVAHLDSVNGNLGPAAAAPGADDNASGSAGLIQIGRSLGNTQIDHDLRLLLVGGEEQGLHGSRQYVESLSNIERARIRAVLNMDMIGCLNTQTPTVMLEGAALSQSLIDGLSAAAATYTNLTVETSLNPFASDHVSFLQTGIPAVLTIEGADSANTNIHTANDTVDHIDYDIALEILRMNVAFVATQLQN
jgi:hypothetical protein